MKDWVRHVPLPVLQRMQTAYLRRAMDNIAIANQQVAIARARKFDHDHADAIAMDAVEGRNSIQWQLRLYPLIRKNGEF